RPADVLGGRRLIEAQIAVKPVPEVVAVEQERRAPHLEQPLLDGGRDGRLARSRQAREPERGTAVAELAPAPLTGHSRALPAHVRAALAGPFTGLLDLGVEDHAGGDRVVGGLV